jgi:Flp pilus assembly pilin Flp
MARLAKIRICVWRWLRQEDGPTAAEYAIMLCLIVVALVGSIVGMAQAMQRAFGAMTDVMTAALPG